MQNSFCYICSEFTFALASQRYRLTCLAKAHFSIFILSDPSSQTTSTSHFYPTATAKLTSVYKMAPPVLPAYAKDERVLCFHHELLYEAKVLDYKHTEPNDKKTPLLYRVHYKGWKNT